MKFKKLIVPVLFLLIIFNAQFITAAEPTDISNHWAQDYILNLLNNEIMETYPDNTFKPDHNITRGEFALALAKGMNILPVNTIYFNDLDEYPGFNLINALAEKEIIGGYPDGTFKPRQPITRAEAVHIMIRALDIRDKKVVINLDNYEPFNDIPENHWALNNIKIAKKIELISRDQDAIFNPDRKITRADAAKYLSKYIQFSTGTGYIADIYPTSNKISFNLLDGERKVLNFGDEALIGRNNRLVDFEEILKTDKVFMISDANDNVKYAKAYGMITQDDLATEVSTMTEGILDPDDVSELATGNINSLRPKVVTAVEDQLLKQGLNQDEVTAIMGTEWNKLESLSKTRLSEAIAIQTGLPLDITRSLLDGDWEKIKTYGQIELVQRLVQEVLDSDLIS